MHRTNQKHPKQNKTKLNQIEITDILPIKLFQKAKSTTTST